ncbi:MAG: ABC transporter permease [Gemmatimonadaceae bacterium]
MRQSDRVGELIQDVRFALRTLSRQRLPVAMGALCLLLGIGATTTVFDVANTLFFQPLPFPRGDRLVSVGTHLGPPSGIGVASQADYVDVRARARSMDALGAFRHGDFTLHGIGAPASAADSPMRRGDKRASPTDPERLSGAYATAGLFRALGVSAERGRLFLDGDEHPGAPKVVVLSHALAQRLFGGPDRAIGATMRLGGALSLVVGVLADAWRFPESSEIWVPLTLDAPLSQRGNRSLEMLGSLAPDVRIEAARHELTTIASDLARLDPEHDTALSITVDPLRDRYVGAARAAFAATAAAALLVLLIACANVASLQLARTSTRTREIAVRIALGAGRGRLVRQLLTESVLLALVGGVLGIALALVGARSIARAVGAQMPSWMTFTLDARVLAFTVLVAGASGILFGIVPALRLVTGSTPELLRAGGRGGTVGRGGTRLYRALVIAQLALSVMLLVGAALATQSFLRLRRTDPGFDPSGVITYRLTLQGPRYESHEGRARFVQSLVERLATIPGVAAAGATGKLPVAGCCSRFGVEIAGQPADPGRQPMIAGSVVTPGFFRAIGAPLLRGRDFAPSDRDTLANVVVVSESFAGRYWPGEEPIGKRVDAGGGMSSVIGVVRDMKLAHLFDQPEPQIYKAHAQSPWADMSFTVRAAGALSREPTRLVPAIRAAVHEADPALPIFSVATMSDVLTRSVASERLYGVLLGVFAAAALILSVAGLYGVLAYLVAQRTRELGIRLALGGSPASVRRLVLAQGGAMAGAGVAVGLAGAVAVARLLRHVLYGVAVQDPLPYLAVATLLSAVALIACWGPARRATRIDPALALRSD